VDPARQEQRRAIRPRLRERDHPEARDAGHPAGRLDRGHAPLAEKRRVADPESEGEGEQHGDTPPPSALPPDRDGSGDGDGDEGDDPLEIAKLLVVDKRERDDR
jgi:hypothetical protein